MVAFAIIGVAVIVRGAICGRMVGMIVGAMIIGTMVVGAMVVGAGAIIAMVGRTLIVGAMIPLGRGSMAR